MLHDETEEEENIVHSVWAHIENPTKNKVVNVKEAPEVDFIKDAVDKIADIKSKNPRQVDVYEKPITDFESLQNNTRHHNDPSPTKLGKKGKKYLD